MPGDLGCGPRAATLAALCMAMSGCYNDAADYRHLVASNVQTQGWIFATSCRYHRAVYYAYRASDGEHHDLASPRAHLDCERLKRGDPVVVYFDPTHPQTSTVLGPRQAYEEAHGLYVPEWVPAFFGPIVVIVLSILLNRGRSTAGRAPAVDKPPPG